MCGNTAANEAFDPVRIHCIALALKGGYRDFSAAQNVLERAAGNFGIVDLAGQNLAPKSIRERNAVKPDQQERFTGFRRAKRDMGLLSQWQRGIAPCALGT